MKDYLEKRREELSKREGGFTLMEMLIVVAIIAVLIAIAIPIFTSQLEKSREAADAANVRSKYAEVTMAMIEEPTASSTVSVEYQQGQDNWQNTEIGDNLSALADEGYVEVTGQPKAGGSATLSYSAGKLQIKLGE